MSGREVKTVYLGKSTLSRSLSLSELKENLKIRSLVHSYTYTAPLMLNNFGFFKEEPKTEEPKITEYKEKIYADEGTVQQNM